MHPRDASSAAAGRRDRARVGGAAVRATALLALPLALVACGGRGSSATSTPPTITSLATATRTALATQPADVFGRIPSIVRRVQPNVVTVLTPQGVGSGVIYRANGVILTNDHVVHGHTTVEIAFADGQRLGGKVTATDPDTDLALVKVDRTGLPAASFDRKLPAVGALADVLGSPLGFEKSVSAGIVSGLHRSLPGSARETRALVDLLQTDAPISPGNSGGAVVDARGRVIGITDAYVPPQQGAVAIGFAIPAATAVRVADELLRNGRVEHAFVGIQPAELTPELAQALRVGRSTGVLVYAVERGGPADRAGIQPGDVLISLAGRPLDSVEQLFAALRLHRPGQEVAVVLLRDGKRQSVKVRLSKTPG
jgi:S1-C subfamily serine protease